MKVAAISLNQTWENKEANKRKCQQYIIKASFNFCDLIIFPEMTLTGFSMKSNFIKEDLTNSETIQWFIEMAKTYHINIIFGMVLGKNKQATNNAICISVKGDIICNYAKIHPFTFAKENIYYEGGNKLGIFEIEDIQFGMTICYDLRFPELYQALSKSVSIIINIANWPERRVDHWNILTSARAIENQVYMLAVNRTGIDGNGLAFIKSSKIIDPIGNIVKPITENKEIDIYELDINNVNLAREVFPFKKDRKVEFYLKNL